MKTLVFLLCFLLAGVNAAALPGKWAQALLRNRKNTVCADLTRQAFARSSHFANRAYLFSPAEKTRILTILQTRQNQSAKDVQKLLHTRPAALARAFAVPKVQKGKARFITDFTPFLPARARHLPAYPAALFPGDVARGMVLKNPAKDLREIFKQGLLARRSGVDAWTGKRVIFMVNSTDIAALYTRTDTPGLPVLVHISGFNGQQNYMPETSQDIPADRVVRVSALLKLDGKAVWGQLTPAADGFLFHPYALTPVRAAQNAAQRLWYRKNP